ncbi:hypothetical protein [Paraburkholderia sp. GAS334]|uniref:hypothetical protein n=1 Tax=Paraburkholderia sp. GAS334 TaxID=3035131 RepID=UPI003D212BA3
MPLDWAATQARTVERLKRDGMERIDVAELNVPHPSALTRRALCEHAAVWGYDISANRYAILDLQASPGRETCLIAEMKLA